ncbi:MAG: GNAT family N-acetyltransferase [Aromatoleum sp.]|jgi:hypothetical protein|uniref:GNAT family N-acetyltransferase n=1 Tax=Aromatoleum sp. TaxID=2307007 RepID=UPI0028955584|nr:GNAT family N-acetyltransferase [Aromatoleum sp.]MDT3670690.1 GNAT family N-acetyltransferase [Aromatoleum sp.]
MIGRLTSAIRQLGAIDGVLYLAHRALGMLSSDRAGIFRYYLVAQPVPDAPPPAKAAARSAVSLIDAQDPLCASFPRPPHVIAKRFRDGNLCFASRSGERISGFLWLANDAYEEDEVRCLYRLEQPEQSAWDYDVYVEPEYRLGRTFVRLWEAANRHLATEGVRWSFSRISGFNPGSLQVHRKLGIRRLFSATFVRVGPVQITFAGASPYIHVSLSARTRPTLRLSPPPDARNAAPRAHDAATPSRATGSRYTPNPLTNPRR